MLNPLLAGVENRGVTRASGVIGEEVPSTGTTSDGGVCGVIPTDGWEGHGGREKSVEKTGVLRPVEEVKSSAWIMASTIDVALGKRSSGSFERLHRMTSESAGGMAGLIRSG